MIDITKLPQYVQVKLYYRLISSNSYPELQCLSGIMQAELQQRVSNYENRYEHEETAIWLFDEYCQWEGLIGFGRDLYTLAAQIKEMEK